MQFRGLCIRGCDSGDADGCPRMLNRRTNERTTVLTQSQSVVITAILSSIFLKERLSFIGKIGCFMCIIGSVVIVINAPEQSSVATIQDMKGFILSPGFLSYAGVVIVASIGIIWWVAPRYGKKSMMVYLTVCSLIGGLR